MRSVKLISAGHFLIDQLTLLLFTFRFRFLYFSDSVTIHGILFFPLIDNFVAVTVNHTASIGNSIIAHSNVTVTLVVARCMNANTAADHPISS